MNELIDVACCVFPTGEVLWFEAEKGSEYLSKVTNAWIEQNPEFVGTKCTSGIIQIWMPVDKFNAIQASNNFDWPE